MKQRLFKIKQIIDTVNVIPERKILTFVYLVSISVGIISALFYYNETPVGDSTYYFNAANLIKENVSNLFNSRRIGIVESLNAIIQGFAFILPGNDFVAIYFLQVLAFTVTALYIYLLADKLIKRLGALLTLVFYLINYNHWLHIYSMKPGVWVNLFVIATLYYAFSVFQETTKRKNFGLFGIFAALLLLTDLRYIPHVMFILFMFLFTHVRLSHMIKNNLLSLTIMLLVITPWIIRQSIVFDKLIFISDLSTITISSVFKTEKFKSLSRHTGFLANIGEDSFQNRFWGICDTLALSPGELIYTRIEAKKAILNTHEIKVTEKYKNLIDEKIFTESQIIEIIEREENKPRWIKIFKRAFSFWAPFKLRYSYDPLSEDKSFIPPASVTNNINRIVTLGILLPAFILGIVTMFKKKNLFGITLSGIFLIHTLVHALTWVQWRYMLPILPLITLIAFYGLQNVVSPIFTNGLIKFHELKMGMIRIFKK